MKYLELEFHPFIVPLLPIAIAFAHKFRLISYGDLNPNILWLAIEINSYNSYIIKRSYKRILALIREIVGK